MSDPFERIRSTFEGWFGLAPSSSKTKTKTKTTGKQVKQVAKGNATRGASKTGSKTKQGSVVKTGSKSASQIGKVRSRSNSRSSSASARAWNVFAPRLLPMTTSSMAVNPEDWLSTKSMAGSGFHCAAYLIHCTQHNKVAVSKPTSQQAMWMPFTPIPPNRSWEETGLTGLLVILAGADVELFIALKEQPPFVERTLIEVYDVQLPHTLAIITRLTWYVRLDQRLVKSAHFKCCQDTEWLVWIKSEDIDQQKDSVLQYMWGSELMELAILVATCQKAKLSLCTTFKEFGLEMALKHLPRDPPADHQQQLLLSARLSEKDIERLYADYLDHCYPSSAMAPHSFKVYMTKYGIKYDADCLDHYFRAFNSNGNGVISFPELLLGLACIDSKSVHNSERALFVLRYYDVFSRGYLTEDDVRLMIQDMHAAKGITEEAVEEKLAELMRKVPTEQDPQTGKAIFHQRYMLLAIGQHEIRGTSKLCRIGRPICAAISSAIFARAQRNRQANQKIGAIIEPQYSGTCIGCRSKRPVLGEELAKLSPDGYLIEMVPVDELKQLEKKESPSISSRTKTKSSRQSSQQKSAQGKKPNKSPGQSLSSLSSVEGVSVVESAVDATSDPQQMVEAQAVAMKLIKKIRQFAPKKGNTLNPVGLLAQTEDDRKHFLEQLELIERVLGPNLKKRRWVPVPSPAYIIGDIHGNLDDLLALERSIWKRFPLAGPNLVFLGDMVDRGKWGIECATYLFCLSVLAPSPKVTLLRGNHEVRSLQCNYTYRNECLAKYGEELGNNIWELTNRLFDMLPLCAVVDEAVYCAHGGIPRTSLSLEDLAAQPTEIADPEHESPIAWEILWSDPVTQPQFVDMARIFQVDVDSCEGFLPNTKRGTAYAFGEVAADQFLAVNGLSHIVRAHEVPQNGFKFNFDKKCLTIFSCSHYCGNNNECAVLFIDRDQLRPVGIDTSHNLSATD